MHRPSRPRLVPPGRLAWPTLVTCLLLATSSGAQPAASAAAAPASRPDPLDARAPVPATAPPSALAGYRPSTDVSVGSWRDANDTVARIGGWRAYAREARAASAPAPASAASR